MLDMKSPRKHHMVCGQRNCHTKKDFHLAYGCLLIQENVDKGMWFGDLAKLGPGYRSLNRRIEAHTHIHIRIHTTKAGMDETTRLDEVLWNAWDWFHWIVVHSNLGQCVFDHTSRCVFLSAFFCKKAISDNATVVLAESSMITNVMWRRARAKWKCLIQWAGEQFTQFRSLGLGNSTEPHQFTRTGFSYREQAGKKDWEQKFVRTNDFSALH